MTERRGGWPGPRKTQVVVPFDPAQLAQVEEYAEQHDIKRVEAVRRLVAAGLDTWTRPGRTGRPKRKETTE